MPTYVMVLADGETWTQLDGCVILKFDTEPLDKEVKNPRVNQIYARFTDKQGLPEVHGWDRLFYIEPHRTPVIRYNRPIYAGGPDVQLTDNESKPEEEIGTE